MQAEKEMKEAQVTKLSKACKCQKHKRLLHFTVPSKVGKDIRSSGPYFGRQ